MATISIWCAATGVDIKSLVSQFNELEHDGAPREMRAARMRWTHLKIAQRADILFKPKTNY